jgi:hypothetical protein
MTLEAMERGDTIVYGAAGGEDYVARFDELGWTRWPATTGGWRKRRPASEQDVDTDRELPPDLARLALRLSGVGD